MNEISIVIVDDNNDSIEILQYFISQLQDFKILAVCSNGEELIESVMREKPDLILADINMPKKNGIQAIEECRQFQPQLNFIFITGYDDYAVDAFNLSAVDYIVKPVEKSRLYLALEKAKSVIRRKGSYPAEQISAVTEEAKEKRLPIKFNGSLFYIPLKDIIYIEKSIKKSLIHTSERTYESYENISDLVNMLDESFYQTHRSYIVNLSKISHITPRNETYLAYFFNFHSHAHVSKLKINELQEKMEKYIAN
ncbi:LytTR family DNA-binding domain-containing protein [Metabacillus sp. GX 13764]|uniref:LytR/AlgR family response regulator transcription factor n=1 Tax=Metabacillus kandeliae TaxID=2900151 RepID=UPI001E328AB3|nr:LytTR family DNA-binding domain-containing protein [Metabacillus kandeliae]MCD7036196.1 LytTR family DNA-binding domain-containing protein [Metabacillus kandeliae]